MKIKYRIENAETICMPIKLFRAHLRTLAKVIAYSIECDSALQGTCESWKNQDETRNECIECLIDGAIENPTEE